jgi:hypothetical protein
VLYGLQIDWFKLISEVYEKCMKIVAGTVGIGGCTDRFVQALQRNGFRQQTVFGYFKICN